LSESELQQFTKYGYYSKPLKFNNKGKIMAINNNACYNWNTWLLKNRNDPGKQLSWLENELSSLERVGGFAIIISH
jgi:hypothetical protein